MTDGISVERAGAKRGGDRRCFGVGTRGGVLSSASCRPGACAGMGAFPGARSSCRDGAGAVDLQNEQVPW